MQDEDGRRAAQRPTEHVSGARPVIERQRFRGASGMRDLPLEGRRDLRDADGFDADLVQVRLGRMAISRTAITPHRGVIDDDDRDPGHDVLRFMTVTRGVLHIAPAGCPPVRLAAGDAFFLHRQRTYSYRLDEPLVLVMSTLPVTSLPTTVQRLDELPMSALPHSPLVDAVVDLLAGLAARLDEEWAFDAHYAARGLISLQTAILSGIMAPPPPAQGPDRVHLAAMEYIEGHLADPELGPLQIAQALGVSVRYLHRAFGDKERTVARLLRERRLEEVAHVLRAADRRPTLQTLTARSGFGSQDRLARAFRSHFGMSMTAYRAAGDERGRSDRAG